MNSQWASEGWGCRCSYNETKQWGRDGQLTADTSGTNVASVTSTRRSCSLAVKCHDGQLLGYTSKIPNASSSWRLSDLCIGAGVCVPVNVYPCVSGPNLWGLLLLEEMVSALRMRKGASLQLTAAWEHDRAVSRWSARSAPNQVIESRSSCARDTRILVFENWGIFYWHSLREHLFVHV